MFWGLILEPHRRYTHKIERPFHISMAALDVTVADNQVIQVMCCYEKTNFLICTLKRPDMLQCALNLDFAPGTEVAFSTNGNGIVHLTGYLTDEHDYQAAKKDKSNGIKNAKVEWKEDEKKEEEAPKEKSKKKKKKKKNNKQEQTVEPQSKKQKLSVAEDEVEEEESDDPDYVVDEDVFSNVSVEEEEEDEDEDNKDSDDEEVEEDEEEANEEEEDDDEEEEEEEETQQEEVKADKKLKNATGKTARERIVTNGDLELGTKVIDKRLGHGPKAAVGDYITVDYIGKLVKSGKTFDSGKNFTFKLGTNQVISGWDEGLLNVSPGGFRELICPPEQAYGAKGCPPTIPPNATLKFLVTVKSIKRKGKVFK